MSSDLAISLTGIGKAYHVYSQPADRLKQMLFGRFGAHYQQTYWALDNIDLEVRRGETIALIGRNGAGKTTLLEIICGTLTPSKGDVIVDGRIAAMISLGAGFNPEFTGRENAALSATVLGLTAAQIVERLPLIIEFAGIGDFIDQPVKLYSSGMYARLAFAVCAHVDADILVVDEILSVGDAIFGQKCMRFIHEFKKRGTLLFVSHDMAAVVNLCDRALWIERGQIRATGPAKDIAALYLAAVSRESDDPTNFKIGGRRRPPTETLVPDFTPSREIAAPLFQFDQNLRRAETATAVIGSVSLRSGSGVARSSYVGGDTIILDVVCRLTAAISSLIVVFEWRDRLGQLLFSDDTSLAALDPDTLAAGQIMTARFTFDLPDLPAGEFAVSAAILHDEADGYIIDDYQLDALIVRIERQQSFGLVGATITAIDFKVFS